MDLRTKNIFADLNRLTHSMHSLGGYGYAPSSPHGRLHEPTMEAALALVATADCLLNERKTRGPHYAPYLEQIEGLRAELLEALDEVPGKPATSIAAGRRSA